MNVGVGLLLSISCLNPSDLLAQPVPTAAVTGGAVHGRLIEGGGAAFLGVPFAQPPVGEFRWREPMPVTPWSGVKDATSYGSPCAQLGRQGPSGSDDCLYLNVWVPEWPRDEPATARYLEFTPEGPVGKANILPAHCTIFLEWVRQHMNVAK